jgi:hypothetical protein
MSINVRPNRCSKYCFTGNQLFLNMFRASLRPSSGGRTAFPCLWFSVLVVAVVMLESRGAPRATRHSPTSWRWAQRRPKHVEEQLITNKSLFAASSWSHLYLLIKDARSSEYNICMSTVICLTNNIPHTVCRHIPNLCTNPISYSKIPEVNMNFIITRS